MRARPRDAPQHVVSYKKNLGEGIRKCDGWRVDVGRTDMRSSPYVAGARRITREGWSMTKKVSNEKAKLVLNTNFILGVPLFTRGEQEAHIVNVDVSQLTKEAALSHLVHGIKQRVTDAAAMPKGTSREDRIKAAEEAAKAIEANTTRTRESGYTERQNMAITMFAARKHSGKLPKGGKATVIGEIGQLPEPKAEAFWKQVDAALSSEADW